MPDKQDELNPNSDLGPFADALKRLAPQPPHLSRDALLFAAGKATATGPLKWAWPSSTALFAGISFVLAAFLMSPNSPRVEYVNQVVYVDRPATTPASHIEVARSTNEPAKPKSGAIDSSVDVAKAYQVHRDVLRWGIEMLPDSRTAGGGLSQDAIASELRLRHWLNTSSGTFASPVIPKKPTKKEDDE